MRFVTFAFVVAGLGLVGGVTPARGQAAPPAPPSTSATPGPDQQPPAPAPAPPEPQAEQPDFNAIRMLAAACSSRTCGTGRRRNGRPGFTAWAPTTSTGAISDTSAPTNRPEDSSCRASGT